MQITLYNQSLPTDRLTRSMSGAVTLTGYLREACDILTPSIRINYDAALVSKNYAYIPDFHRYYYYEKPPSIEGDIMVLHLYADSLYNYRNEILNADCIAERSSSNFNLFLKDSALLGEVGYEYFSRSFSGGASFTPDHGNYILMTGGK